MFAQANGLSKHNSVVCVLSIQFQDWHAMILTLTYVFLSGVAVGNADIDQWWPFQYVEEQLGDGSHSMTTRRRTQSNQRAINKLRTMSGGSRAESERDSGFSGMSGSVLVLLLAIPGTIQNAQRHCATFLLQLFTTTSDILKKTLEWECF